jgi:hypothetical protein
MLRVIRPAVVTGLSMLTIAVTACAPLRVDTYLDRHADVTGYRSYAWAENDAFATGDPRLDNNRFFVQRIEEAVDMQLAARGLEKTTPGTAEVLIHIHARMEQQVEPARIDRIDGHCVDNDCRPVVYDVGTLMVDVMEARRNRLVWRGWAERAFDGVIDDQRALERTVDDVVARIMARWPGTPL